MLFINLFDKKKAKKLKDINLNEISFVDKPANKQDFVFFKSQQKADWLEVVAAADIQEFELSSIEVTEVEDAFVHFEKLSESERDAISTLVLGSGGKIPAVSVDKDDTITIGTDDEDEEKILSDALKTIGDLSSDQLSAVRVLLKMGSVAELLWPSLSGQTQQQQTVKKNTSSLKWPSLSQHVPEEQEVEPVKKSDLLWPSLAVNDNIEIEPVKKDTSGLLWPSLA